MSEETAQVANLYRSSMGSALPGARAAAERVRTALDAVTTAMDAGAWDGGTSQEFYEGCTTKKKAASTAADDCVDELTTHHNREPVKVDDGDWRAVWGTRRQMIY